MRAPSGVGLRFIPHPQRLKPHLLRECHPPLRLDLPPAVSSRRDGWDRNTPASVVSLSLGTSSRRSQRTSALLHRPPTSWSPTQDGRAPTSRWRIDSRARRRAWILRILRTRCARSASDHGLSPPPRASPTHREPTSLPPRRLPWALLCCSHDHHPGPAARREPRLRPLRHALRRARIVLTLTTSPMPFSLPRPRCVPGGRDVIAQHMRSQHLKPALPLRHPLRRARIVLAPLDFT
ncbi:hypothetical protein B0H17DRAFT_360232 [Mycena rosella]|uniref:Uncharacterized protein n=1 Tax=Mycena rosella TaxID=1033263 RepID=A0AAD7G4U0_MYCRO|nr:hypothetical protein B0H17DRAFT_360232 [Mycena rosella]